LVSDAGNLAMNPPKATSTEVLNVDLDITVKQGLSVLLSELEASLFVLNKTETTASLELTNGSDRLDEVVLGLIQVVQQLSKKARSIWDRCDSRTFNIGFTGGSMPHEKQFSLSSETIGLLAGIRGEIAITIYACGISTTSSRRQQ
jgi:hypothetical protein